MKKEINLWPLMGFALTSISGTLLHFLYDWLGNSPYVAAFSGVNESTWEHMKLLFWPMFIFAIAQSIFFRDNKNFWCITLRGILLGLFLIQTIFYLYNGIIGKSPDWLNITIFFVSAALAYLYQAKLFKSDSLSCRSQKRAFLTLLIIAALFVVFTFKPPHIAIFKDPITSTYGI